MPSPSPSIISPRLQINTGLAMIVVGATLTRFPISTIFSTGKAWGHVNSQSADTSPYDTASPATASPSGCLPHLHDFSCLSHCQFFCHVSSAHPSGYGISRSDSRPVNTFLYYHHSSDSDSGRLIHPPPGIPLPPLSIDSIAKRSVKLFTDLLSLQPQ